MKVLEGHLTATDKKAVKAILDKGLFSGRVGKADYFIGKGVNVFYVSKMVIDKGLIPVVGSKPRLSTYKSTIEYAQ